MFNRARRQLRSWMFIYAGLVAAIVMAGKPADVRASAAELMPQPAIAIAAPIARRDI